MKYEFACKEAECQAHDKLLINDNSNFFFFFLAVLGLRSCTQAFSSCGQRRLLFVAVRGLLIAVACFVAELGL